MVRSVQLGGGESVRWWTGELVNWWSGWWISEVKGTVYNRQETHQW